LQFNAKHRALGHKFLGRTKIISYDLSFAGGSPVSLDRSRPSTKPATRTANLASHSRWLLAGEVAEVKAHGSEPKRLADLLRFWCIRSRLVSGGLCGHLTWIFCSTTSAAG